MKKATFPQVAGLICTVLLVAPFASGCKSKSKPLTPLPDYHAGYGDDSGASYTGGQSGDYATASSGSSGSTSGSASNTSRSGQGNPITFGSIPPRDPIEDPNASANNANSAKNNALSKSSYQGNVPYGLNTTSLDDMLLDKNHFAGQTVYFNYDKAVLRTSDFDNLDKVMKYLVENKQYGLLIEGHADERGTEGYNLALGEKRALAVREYLVNSGVDSNRIRTISYGETRPAVPGNGDQSHEKNRRGEFVLLRPKS